MMSDSSNATTSSAVLDAPLSEASTEACPPNQLPVPISPPVSQDDEEMFSAPPEFPFDLPSFLSHCPKLPGVYKHLNAAGDVLYVGKARNLHLRIASYFNQSVHSPRIAHMLRQVVKVEITVTRSETEALLLESNLIKSLSPRYNIIFRDDKSYPYIRMSAHPSPQISYYRGLHTDKHQYFGPFPNGVAARSSLKILQRVFRLRTCEDSVFAHRSRPCLLHQINRCSAPCTGEISPLRYQNDVNDSILFLSGRSREVINVLQQRMSDAASNLRYEEAAIVRDQIAALSQVVQSQVIEVDNEQEVDLIAVVVEEGQAACVNLAMVRDGRHLGDRQFFPHQVEGFTAPEVLMAFIVQHYPGRFIPSTLIINQALDDEDVNDISLALSGEAGRKITILRFPREERRVWLEMAEQGAKLALGRYLAERNTAEARTRALAEMLGLDEPSGGFAELHIECFDVSHTGGEATQAACVVYHHHKMQGTDYRRFNITGMVGGDDYGALRDALTRRYEKIVAGKGLVPDLILIDGGKGQLAIAKEVLSRILNEAGLPIPLIVGVAKGEGRKPGLETMVFADSREPQQWDSTHPALHLVQTLRDEAHRFAITGQRNRRDKTRIRSSLQEIPGVGPKRRQQLLIQFGGLQGVRSASVEDLSKVPGISLSLAERIYAQMRG